MKLFEATNGEYFVPFTSQALHGRWTRLLTKHNLPRMTFHDLRHINASLMLFLHIPEKYAKEHGGCETDRVSSMPEYFSAERIEINKKIDSCFEHLMQHGT